MDVYCIQFELLADQNGWNDEQRAVQLATSPKYAALEGPRQLSVEERSRCSSLVEVLEGYATVCQSEMYKTRLRIHVRARGESLQQLTQDLESVAQRLYPAATANLLALLFKEQFIDTVGSEELRVQVCKRYWL